MHVAYYNIHLCIPHFCKYSYTYETNLCTCRYILFVNITLVNAKHPHAHSNTISVQKVEYTCIASKEIYLYGTSCDKNILDRPTQDVVNIIH